jgi:hypothetical protein
MARIHPRRLLISVALTAAAVTAATCAKSEKSENPLSPYVAGPMPGVEITLPVLMEPGQGWRLKANEQPITLLVENAASNSPRPLLYRFEVAADGGFRNIVYAREGIAQGEGGQTGRTALRLPDPLQNGRVYFWRARAYDGANTGNFAVGLNFEIQLPSQLFDPQLLEPVNGQTSENQRPHLKVRNSPRQGPILNVNYAFQVARDPGFTQVLALGSMPENTVTGETIWLPNAELPVATTVYWRSMSSDGQVSSPWAVSSFRTPAAAGPGPGPGGPPTPILCGSPATHYDVVACQRSAYGTPVGHNNLNTLMRAIAADLNRRGFSGGPFGVLVKTTGANCGGISCDIICAGNGAGQRQWDVLIDGEGAAAPTWSPVATPNVRPCEIR